MNLSVNLDAENVAVEKKKWHSDFPQCRVMSSTESPLRVTVETSNVAVQEEEQITVF